MTMPKKGTRSIEVNGIKFRWKAVFYDYSTGTFDGTRVRMICEAVDGSSVMEATALDEYSSEVTFGPYAASQFITAALEKGWDPNGNTNFTLSTQKEPLSIPTKPSHSEGFSITRSSSTKEAPSNVADEERRLKWAQKYLDCDPNTGEPGYQELITPQDLVNAMKAEATHLRGQ
jgi:hypothetical protein